jgi:ABC-2 type transport system permease protein
MNTKGFPGWTFDQIILFQGIFIMMNALDRMFFQKVDWSLSHDVRSGSFDRYLLYPLNTLAYISFINFGLEHIADFAVGIVLVIYAIIKLGIAFSFMKAVLFFALISLGVIFIFALAIFKYSIIIRSVSIGRIGEFFRVVKTYGQYPVNIYSKPVEFALKFILPFAIFAYFPATAVIENASDNFFIIAGVIITFFLWSLWLWKNTLKYYTSAGG